MCSGRLFSPACLPSRIDVKAELGGDHHLVADRRERFADQLFVGERTVDLSVSKYPMSLPLQSLPHRTQCLRIC